MQRPESAAAESIILLDLIPLGHVDPLALEVVAAHLYAILGLKSKVQPERPEPQQAWIPERRQMDAARLLKHLAAERHGAFFKLGLTSADLCIPILTYVFGESQLGGRAAVVSLHRLGHTAPGRILERAARIALHETGHLLGLEHCLQRDCLMRFCRHLAQLDELPLLFCPACGYEAQRRIALAAGRSVP